MRLQLFLTGTGLTVYVEKTKALTLDDCLFTLYLDNAKTEQIEGFEYLGYSTAEQRRMLRRSPRQHWHRRVCFRPHYAGVYGVDITDR